MNARALSMILTLALASGCVIGRVTHESDGTTVLTCAALGDASCRTLLDETGARLAEIHGGNLSEGGFSVLGWIFSVFDSINPFASL